MAAPDHRRHRGRRERGTVLMLMPAAVLVLIVLGAIAVDSAITFMAQRNLVAAADDASNDAADVAVSQGAVLGHGRLVLDRVAAVRAVETVLRRDGIDDAVIENVRPRPDGHGLTVVISRQVHLVFASAVPGISHRATVRATVTVTDVES